MTWVKPKTQHVVSDFDCKFGFNAVRRRLSDHDCADFSYKCNQHYGIFLLRLLSCLLRLPPHFYPESQHPSFCHSCFPNLSVDDGALRIWKNFADQKNPEMVTAWQGLSDMLPTTRGQPPAGIHSKDQRSILLCAFLPSSLRSYSQNNPCSSSPTAPLFTPSQLHFHKHQFNS